jgi:hypothetical protein
VRDHRLANLGMEPGSMTTAELNKMLKADYETAGALAARGLRLTPPPLRSSD